MFKIVDEQSAPKTKENYNELIEVKELPSGFKTYNTTSVYLRGLTVGEVRALNRSSDVSFKTLVKVYANVIKEVKIEDLLPIDFKALMFYVAKITDTDFAIKAESKCPSCGNSFPITIKLEDIEFDDLESKNIIIDDMVFNHIRIRDLLMLDAVKTRLGDELNEEYDDELSILTFCKNQNIANIDQIDDAVSMFIEEYNKLSALPAKPYSTKLNDVYKKINLGLKNIAIKCPSEPCGREYSSALELNFTRLYL